MGNLVAGVCGCGKQTFIPCDICIACARSKGLIVAPSVVCNGMGLFCGNVDGFGGGMYIEYVGEILKRMEEDKRYNIDEIAPYGVRRQDGLLIDAALHRGIASIANHSALPNAELLRRGGKVWLHTLSRIEHGDEILVDYGYNKFVHHVTVT